MTFGDLVNHQTPDAPSALFSPVHEFLTPVTLTFWFSIYQGNIHVYQYAGAYKRKLVTLTPAADYVDRFKWRKHSMCVPEGTYQLAFVGDIEVTQYTAIDDVNIDSLTPCTFPLTSGTDY